MLCMWVVSKSEISQASADLRALASSPNKYLKKKKTF